jgi:hypothetical protein
MFEWIITMLGIGSSIIGLFFGISVYFNTKRRPKKYVAIRGILSGVVLSLLIFSVGSLFIPEKKSVNDSSENKVGVEPYIVLKLEYPYTEEFPEVGMPMFNAPTQRYIWLNKGGPIQHADLQFSDLLKVKIGVCNESGSFQEKLIPMSNSTLHQSPIDNNAIQAETPFFVPFDGDELLTEDINAIYGVEFEEQKEELNKHIQIFNDFIKKSGVCGGVSKSSRIAKFSYVDNRGNEFALFYEFGVSASYSTISRKVWENSSRYVSEDRATIQFDIRDLKEPCNLLETLEMTGGLNVCRS